MFQKYRKFISLFTVLATVFTLGGIAYLIDMHITNASVAADFDVATHAAPTATFNSSTTNGVIMGIILPTPNNDTSLAGTAPAVGTAVTGTNPWSGATIAVMFRDAGTSVWEPGSDFIATDDDLDDVYTSAADTQVDCDGSTTTGAGTCTPPAAGTAIVATETADNLCTNNLTTPTIIFIDAEVLDCTTDISPLETNLLGTAVASTSYISVGANWAFRDGEVTTNTAYDDGEDLYIESTANELTYSAAADTTLAGTAPAAGSALTGINPWSSATPPVRFFDGGTAGTWESGSDFIMTDDDASGYYRGDELTSVVVSNAGTALDADISAIKIWEDGASAGFDGDETEVGSDSATPYWDQTITTASAGVYTSTSNNERIFITVNVVSSPTDGNTIQARLGTNSVVLVSTNDGPTDSALTNANTQTLNNVFGSTSTPPDTTPPAGATITINSDVASTTVREVKLQLSATGATWYEVSEDSLFTGASQLRFFEPSMEIDFTLSAGEGTKRVYARYMDDAGNFSGNVSDTIVLGTVVVEEEPPAPMFADGDLVREAGSNDVYIVKLVEAKKFKRLILNPAIFESYGHLEWSNVQDVVAGTLAAYTLSDMILEDGGTKVYKVSSATGADTGTKQWLNMTAAAFEACGYDWDSLYMVNSTEVSDSFYPVGADITSC